MYLMCFVPFVFYIILKEGGTRLRVPPGLLTQLWFRGHVKHCTGCPCAKRAVICKTTLPIFLSRTVARVCNTHVILCCKIPLGPCPSVCRALSHAYATHMRSHVTRLPCPSFCRALSHAYATNMRCHCRQCSCPSFCLALSTSGRDEMFGQARQRLFKRAASTRVVCSYCSCACVRFEVC